MTEPDLVVWAVASAIWDCWYYGQRVAWVWEWPS